MRIKAPTLLVLAAFAVAAPSASAAVVLDPAGAVTNMGEFFPAGRTLNQSGLSIPYTSLLTDFDTYIASGPTAYHGEGSNIWGATLGVRAGNFDFALGGNFLVSALVLWNLAGDPSSVRQFNILVDDNASFSSPDNLGTFTASNSLGSEAATGAQVFTFTETAASFVRLQILNTWSGTSNHTAFNEVAFRVPSVPEPSAALLGLLGGIGLFLRRIRKG